MTNIDIPATPGALSTTGVPAGTTAMWTLNGSAVPGQSVSASLMTSGADRGHVHRCSCERGADRLVRPGDVQLPEGHARSQQQVHPEAEAIYNAKTGTWREAVIVPGPGKLIFAHRTIVAGGTPRPLIKTGKLTVARPARSC